MIPELVVCPGCRVRTAKALELRTLDRRGDLLVCECGRRYPIIDGVPIVLADPTAYLRGAMTTVVERDLSPEVAALLVETGPDDHPYAQLLEHLSIYLDAHWGDRAEPPPEHAGFGARAILERLAALPRVGLAIELGCSTGRLLAALAATADHAVGLDLQFGAVRRARRLLAGEPLAYNRRLAGRRYTSATVTPGAPIAATLLCGDALDPPFVPGRADRVVALNLLDSVARPRLLLAVLDGLCAPGGELIVSSPYAWQSSVMEDGERLGEADPAAAVAAILTTGAGLRARYTIEEEADVSWTLRRDARSAVDYRVHYLRARKS